MPCGWPSFATSSEYGLDMNVDPLEMMGGVLDNLKEENRTHLIILFDSNLGKKFREYCIH